MKYRLVEPSVRLSEVSNDIAVAANFPAEEIISVDPTVRPYSITNVFCVPVAPHLARVIGGMEINIWDPRYYCKLIVG
mgnify:CR=1 FL=1